MKHQIIWTLANGQTIVKHGEGVQQVFATLSKKDRTAITVDGTTVAAIPKPTKAEQRQMDREAAREHLLTWIKPGDTVYTVLRHVSRSGMMRHISLKAHVKGDLWDITGYAAELLGDSIAVDGGIKASGCGMDMGFNLVYSLGRAMWPNGTKKLHGRRNGVPDSDGGYALKHRWM